MKQGKSPERVVGAFVGALYAHASFAALKSTEAGCLLAWGRMILASDSSTLSLRDAGDHAVHFARLDAEGFERMLVDLRAMRLVTFDGVQLEVLPLSAAMGVMQAESGRRKDGWHKRRGGVVAVAPAAKTAAPRIASAPARPPAHDEAQTSFLEAAPQANAPEVRRSRREPLPEGVRRFGASDKQVPDDDDTTQLRIPCEGERVAEITASYVAHLQETFLGLDVLHQLRMAGAWCESNAPRRKTFSGLRRFLNTWLSNASREAEVRSAVVRTGKQGNGFGQGGNYESLAPVATVCGRDDLDDFADLFAIPASSAPKVGIQQRMGG